MTPVNKPFPTNNPGESEDSVYIIDSPISGMAKRKNHGFKGVREVYISTTGIPTHYIETLRNVWNTAPLQKEASKELKKIKLLNLKGRGGKFSPTKSYVEVSCMFGLGYTKFAFIHEMAHAVFSRKARLEEESVKKFISTVSKLPPITKYVRSFIGKDKTRWNSYDIYFDEYHSAIAQTIDSDHKPSETVEHIILLSNEDFEIAKSAYLELHERV